MNDVPQAIAENLNEVLRRIDRAAAQSGRRGADVRLIAVTKYVDAAVARALVAAGCRDLGESRPQELWSKASKLPDLDIRWHLIGHLQRNKARRTLPLVSLLHSLDSIRLAEAVEAECSAAERSVAALVEVNISGDSAKHGVLPEEVEPLLMRLARFPHIEIKGLMAMSHREGGAAVARGDFARLRELRDRLLGALPPSMSLEELSMGMSDDFEEAVAEGATMVRVGSALFTGIDL